MPPQQFQRLLDVLRNLFDLGAHGLAPFVQSVVVFLSREVLAGKRRSI